MKNDIHSISKIIPNELFFSEVKSMINAGHEVKISVSGNSMKPFLRDGDLVVLKKFKKKHLSCGDVVLAYHDGSYILHRIVYIKGDRVVLAGDGNFFQVEKIDKNDVLAKVIKAFRNNKSINFRDVRWKVWYKFRFCRFVWSRIFG